MPRESPRAGVSQVVGITRIAIEYHRPAVKGRTKEKALALSRGKTPQGYQDALEKLEREGKAGLE